MTPRERHLSPCLRSQRLFCWLKVMALPMQRPIPKSASKPGEGGRQRHTSAFQEKGAPFARTKLVQGCLLAAGGCCRCEAGLLPRAAWEESNSFQCPSWLFSPGIKGIVPIFSCVQILRWLPFDSSTIAEYCQAFWTQQYLPWPCGTPVTGVGLWQLSLFI